MRRALLSFLIALAACFDPVHADAVDDLGPEDPAIKKGPRHRAGQPCTTCHGERGPGEPAISVGGTVYERRDSAQPASGADVTITDARGDRRTASTNDVGNFHFEKREWDPVFPLMVEVTYQGVTKTMETRIRRDGGCAVCHRDDGDRSHARRVYVLP